jgi:hypothetical protein
MTLLIHLLEHLGLPSGAAVAVAVAGKKLLRSGFAGAGTRRDRDDRDQWRSHDHR